ncbi:hypothetical protein HYH03_008824 [Edaphochlamys debaryana]|uniref:Dihydrodipicolinate reductase N-terminal domain-containing protein n=1 Tax=Edaphochlamys debaryana TaxID=47281 RepID=A0A836BXU4_9CHLO|nr:hypothetical protein HYH03_008824 [Edaphochlamys debaryana]|eukprot:KAG2492910.1 hypothetical protein HYH03_008824 [Edaphochlamys debaryana]
MVNSATGKMGHAAAEAMVAAGFSLVPHSLTGMSAGVAVRGVGVRGTPIQLVGNERRQAALEAVKAAYPNMVVVDYTLAHVVEDHAQLYASNGLPFVMGTLGGDRAKIRQVVEEAGVYAVLPTPEGDQAANLYALLHSLGAALPAHFEQYRYEPIGRGQDGGALDVLSVEAEGDIVRALKLLGINASESAVGRMRASRQQRLEGNPLDREPQPTSWSKQLHTLQGRGAARACRLSVVDADGTEPAPALLLRHYGLDRAAFAAGAVAAARFLAQRVAEGADKKVYDMVDVLRSVRAQVQAAEDAAAARRAGVSSFASNVVAAAPSIAAVAVA